jgi:hypothetical protein
VTDATGAAKRLDTGRSRSRWLRSARALWATDVDDDGNLVLLDANARFVRYGGPRAQLHADTGETARAEQLIANSIEFCRFGRRELDALDDKSWGQTARRVLRDEDGSRFVHRPTF